MSAMYDLQLPEGSWRDWDVTSCSDGELRLAAGTDLSRDHGLELVFQEAVYVACPSLFHTPVFRPPTAFECELVRQSVGREVPVLVAFDIADAERGKLPCLIGAERVEVRQGTVFRYHRTDLKPGERLADWLRAA